MKRRLVLLIGSLGAVLVIFVVCLLIVGTGDHKDIAPPPLPQAALSSRPAGPRGVIEPQEGTDFRSVTRDKDGRLKRVITAPYYESKGEGVYVLSQPKAVIYQRDGQQVQVSADRGTVTSEVLRSGAGSVRLTVKQGDLEGNVKVTVERPPTEEPSAEGGTSGIHVLTISAENIHFDNEKLLLFTNDRVHVTSEQVGLSGRGLSIRWNEDPQELQVLRLEQGDGMVIRSVPTEEVELLALPGGGRMSTAARPELPQAHPPVVESPDRAEVAPAAPGPSRPPPTDRRTDSAPPSPDRPKARNIYTAKFHDNVRVEQGNRYVHGADVLAMEFQWQRSRDSDQRSPIKQPAKVTPGDLVTAVPSGPLPQATGEEPLAPMPPGVEVPTSPAAIGQPTGEPIHLTWSGPLEVVPTGYTDTPSRKDVAVSGRGTVVTLFDGQTSALCREFEFRRKVEPPGDRRQGRLTGGTDAPAVLMLASGEQIVSRSMRFELAASGDTAHLEGEGYVARPAAGEAWSGGAIASEQEGNFECISWANSVDAQLARDDSAEEGQGGVYIRQARFRGDVELSGTAGGDRLRCDDLLVAVQRRKGEGEDRPRTFIQSVLAEGNVVVCGGQEGGRWQAFADRLQGDPTEGVALLEGAPAHLTSRDSTLVGRAIHFQAFKDSDGRFVRGAGLARVVGEGTLAMPIDKDLSGAQLPTPRPATITWAKEMRYVDYGRLASTSADRPEGSSAMASFSGQVHLVSGDEELSCQEMRATFTGSADRGRSAGKAPPPAEEGGSRSLDLGAVSYGGQLWKVYARQDVVLKSHRRDRQDRMQGLAELRAGSVVYDAMAKLVDADQGWLLVQDLRPPQGKSPRSRRDESSQELPSENLESPSQTYFEWSQAMHLGLETRLVQLTGDVWMRHAGGDKIVERESLKDRWQIQDWPDPLPAGRLTDLRCETLLAQFAPPTPAEGNKPTTKSASGDELGAGLNLIGPLDLFVAGGSVLLKDDPWEVVGEKLTYERKQDLITVTGSADGRGSANARVSRKEQGRVVTNESPWIRWYRKNSTRKDDRVETGPMTGSGVILPQSQRRR